MLQINEANEVTSVQRNKLTDDSVRAIESLVGGRYGDSYTTLLL